MRGPEGSARASAAFGAGSGGSVATTVHHPTTPVPQRGNIAAVVPHVVAQIPVRVVVDGAGVGSAADGGPVVSRAGVQGEGVACVQPHSAQSFCDYWGMRHPCGSHPSTVHVNWDKWGSTSDLGRERLIMHETGHSLGLAHHCTSDSIMNQGISTCNGGRWLEVMVYKQTDREGIRSMYPCWRYP